MSIRVSLAVVILGLLAAAAPRASAASLTAQLYPLTGEIRLTNRGLTPVPFVLYTIFSPSGALNSSAAVWRSITDNYDASSNKLIDANNDWFKISASGSTMELSEGVVGDPSSQLPAMRSISLGRVWNVNHVPFPDLTFDIQDSNAQQVWVSLEYAVDGDYSVNETVDQTDYNLYWRQTFGSSTFLSADGNLDGVVDAADFVIWRANLGKSLPYPPFGAGVGAAASVLSAAPVAVPEPAAAELLLAFVGFSQFFGMRRACRLGAKCGA